MLLSYTELMALVERGVIEGVPHEHVNAASIDLTLGSSIMVEDMWPAEAGYGRVDMGDKRCRHLVSKETGLDGYLLQPGEFILAHTREVFHLPNDVSAEYKLKSTQARNGLNHLSAGWADAGWNGSVLTLEFHNVLRYHSILIRPGDKCGQMVFFRHEPVPDHRSYAARGQYNGDASVAAGKVLK